MKNYPMLPLQLISPFFTWRPQQFTVSGYPLSEIMKHAPHPSIYLYDANTITYNLSLLRNALPGRVEIFYAMKANPSLAITQLLVAKGVGVDIVSRGELLVCQKLSVKPQNIVYTSPVKNEYDLKAALNEGVYVNIESLDEAERLSKIAQQMRQKIEIGLRINPDFYLADAHLTLSGEHSSKFGIDISQVVSAARKIKRLPNISLSGIHISVASGVFSAESLLQYYEHCFSIADSLRTIFPIKRIDLGGGLGIPYAANETRLDLLALGRGLEQILARYPQLSTARVIIEPGRYLVGNAGIYICSVDHLKKSGGKELAMVDGGIHHYARPALTGKPNPTYNLSRRGREKLYDIGDKTGTSVGYLGKDLLLSTTKPGDYIGIFNTGSYGLTQSTLAFLSHGWPAEVLIINNEIHTIRKAKPEDEYLKDQSMLRAATLANPG